MLKLEFPESFINSILGSNKKILKHYKYLLKNHSTEIETAAHNVYNQFQEGSENILFTKFHITEADIISKLYSLIKKSVLIDAISYLSRSNKCNFVKSIIWILDNDLLISSYISQHENFLYYYYSLIIFQGKVNKRLLEIFENLYLQ